MADSNYRLPGFQTFVLPREQGINGLATLVRNTLPAAKINNPPDCGEAIEVLGVRIKTKTKKVALYNVYRKQNVPFTVGELFSTVHYEVVIIGGDFNAHHPHLNPNIGKVNPAGTQIISLLQQMPEVTLVAEPQATHVRGGTLDLTLVSTDLYPDIKWSLHTRH